MREEADGVRSVKDWPEDETSARGLSTRRNQILLGVVALIVLIALFGLLYSRRDKGAGEDSKAKGEASANTENKVAAGSEVVLSPQAVQTSGIEMEGVTERPAVVLLRVTGTVESNQQQTQSVTPLISGRIERVYAGLGDRVRAGSVIAVISSPEIAEMHGKLHEAETQLEVAERNYARVQRSENRVAVFQAKARLDEADATLKRTRRLIDLGAGAGKDLVGAETAYKTAKAEYDFQSNISLNKEVQEARAAVDTTRVDVSHIRDQMRALGAPVPAPGHDDHSKDTSLVPIRAPSSGTITERLINAGAGIQPGTPLFTIANISTVWVMANVPEAQIGSIRLGTPAEIHSSALGDKSIAGRVNYIDPQLNEETRTERVRIDVANPGERLKIGMFVEVGFQASTGVGVGKELMVPSSAVQRLGDRTFVFIPKEGDAGHYEVRDVQLGGETDGYQRVIGGLSLGDRVVTKGSFTLKTRLMRGELEEE